MNNDQSFLGGLAPVNNGGVPNNNINDGSVIPGAGLMPVGGPTGASTPAPVAPAGPAPVVPTPIVAGPEPAPAIPGIMAAPDNNSGGAAPAVPGIMDASNMAVPPASSVQSEPSSPNMGLGIVGGNDTNNAPVLNNDILGMGINNSAPMENNNVNNGVIGVDTNNVILGGNINSGPDLMSGGSSPFDIGLGPATVNPSMGSNSIMTNGSANIVGNSADSKPFTNETANSNVEGEEVVSVGTYILNMILFCVPVIGFILILVKAFSKKTNKNVSNFAKAYLIVQFIIVVLMVILMFILFSFAGSSVSQLIPR